MPHAGKLSRRLDPRRLAREAALQMLYALELGGQTPTEVETWYQDHHELPLAARSLAHGLVRLAWDERASSDAVLARHLRDWRPERLSIVDRWILRMAITELRGDTFIPLPALISEYRHLAKKYSQPEALALVQGILNAVAQERRQECKNPPPPAEGGIGGGDSTP